MKAELLPHPGSERVSPDCGRELKPLKISLKVSPWPHQKPLIYWGFRWRRRSESNRRMGLLQSPALPLGYSATRGPVTLRKRGVAAQACSPAFGPTHVSRDSGQSRFLKGGGHSDFGARRRRNIREANAGGRMGGASPRSKCRRWRTRLLHSRSAFL